MYDWDHIIHKTYQSVQMSADPSVDRLSGILERFRVRAELHHTGRLCGVEHFDACDGHGYLHVLRHGDLQVSHPHAQELPRTLHLHEPTLLLYPRPLTHRFEDPPAEGADLTCARLDFDGGACNPLARALPSLVVLPLARVSGLELSLELLFAEADQARCGQRLLADRIFEVVVIQLLRWLLDHPQEAGVHPGFIAGLSDPRLARALVAIHDAPGQAWSLQRMAECAGMSRTAFAELFTATVGLPPIQYLANWRATEARRLLKNRRFSVATVAEMLGYRSEAAFRRFFKRVEGVGPGKVRGRDDDADD